MVGGNSSGTMMRGRTGIDEKLEILIEQVGHLTEGLVDLKLTVERQAETVD